MNIAVYAICYNEEYMLPFFLRHYQAFANKITIYDNHSTDKSVSIMNAAGVDVRNFKTNETIRDDIMIDVKNQSWKESKGLHDWVIVVDIDEFVYSPNIQKFLLKNIDKSIIIPKGYNMFCDHLPNIHNGQIWEQVRLGTPNYSSNSKPCLFNPNKIEEINFSVGAHAANPSGHVVWSISSEIKLLHYAYLTLDFRLKKCANRAKRLSESNLTHGWAVHYLQTPEELEAEYRKKRSNSEIVV